MPEESIILYEKIKKSLLTTPGKCFPATSIEAKLPKAAVAIILCRNSVADEIYVLLIKRKIRSDDPWSGNMALPGGRFSNADKNLVETVIREVSEETGLELSESSLLEKLDEVASSNFLVMVTPYVVLLENEHEPTLKVQLKEIDSFVWIPLSFFKDKNNAVSYLVEHASSGKQLVPSYRYSESHVIWGLTLRIIEDLISRIQ